MNKLAAEFIGTFVLVLFGCGTAIFAGSQVGYLGIAFAFGLAVLVMAYAVGHISGGHFNPAVTIGAWAAKRFDSDLVGRYIVAQIAGAVAAATLIVAMLGYPVVTGFAANVVAPKYSLYIGFTMEAVMTFLFLYVILGVTAKNANSSHAPLAIGLALVCIHLVSIPVTNTSVNPARSISQAFFSADPAALGQLWLFCLAPIVGAALAGLAYRCMESKKEVAVATVKVSKKKR